jgi:hypothetical protein
LDIGSVARDIGNGQELEEFVDNRALVLLAPLTGSLRHGIRLSEERSHAHDEKHH